VRYFRNIDHRYVKQGISAACKLVTANAGCPNEA
jgi:hypothetical protein